VPISAISLEPDPPEAEPGFLAKLQSSAADVADGFGDWAIFAFRAVTGLPTRQWKWNEYFRSAFDVGYSSVAVVAVTGLFIGMVLAVQTYTQFHAVGLDTSIGAIIHMSVVRELGPVLAAVMLAGRIGTAMAAQLGTMRVTEQIDALSCLGVDPVRFLVTPRVLACITAIPLLTILADLMGVVGSTFICLGVFRIDEYHYWRHTENFVKIFDVCVGLTKSILFGGALCLITCHRGFRSRAGAEGVGRAATEGFVISFVAIIFLDFLMAMLTNTVHGWLYSSIGPRLA